MKRLSKYPFLMPVIENWKPRAKKAKLTQKKLAELTGITEVTITNTINLKNQNPKLSTIQRIEDVLTSYGV